MTYLMNFISRYECMFVWCIHPYIDVVFSKGDLEKSEGFKPAEILDRKFKHKLADFEVTVVCTLSIM